MSRKNQLIEHGNTGIRKADNPLTSRHYVVDNPYDLAPVDRILRQIITAEADQASPDAPLVVIMSENHTIPSQRMTQVGVIQALSDWAAEQPSDDSVLFTREERFNWFNQVMPALFTGFGFDIDEAEIGHLASLNYRGELSGILKIANSILHSAADAEVYKAFLSVPQAVYFNDAPYSMNGIDFTNTTARRFLDTVFTTSEFDFRPPQQGFLVPKPVEARNMPLNTYRGLSFDTAFRNAFMVAGAAELVQATGASVVMQHTGSAHLFGFGSSNVNEADAELADLNKAYSLTALYRKAGFRTLSVVFEENHRAHYKRNVNPFFTPNDGDIVISGLSTEPERYSHTLIEQDGSIFSKLQHAYSGASHDPRLNPFSRVDMLNITEEKLYAFVAQLAARIEQSSSSNGNTVSPPVKAITHKKPLGLPPPKQ